MTELLSNKIVMWALALATLGAILAGVLASMGDDRYSTSSQLAVGPSQTLATQADVIDVVGGLSRTEITSSAAVIATSGAVRAAAMSSLGLPAADLDGVEIEAAPVLDANIFEIRVSGPDPAIAAAVANALANETVNRVENIYQVFNVEVITSATVPADGGTSPALVAFGGGVLGGGVGAWFGNRSRFDHGHD